MLQPADILQGAVAPRHPNVFVIGAYDSRITCYSQQVRALELVYALHQQGRLTENMRCAVVGGGAAGAMAAAALALVSQAEIVLYEAGNDVLTLQQASTRRRLDPHIYDWPAVNTSDPVAGLPILDWTSNAARHVRQDVKLEFDVLAAIVGQQLQVKVRHKVVNVEAIGRALQLTFERDPVGAETTNVNRRVEGNDTFNLVLLAFGFGLEASVTGAGVAMPSYWSDAGVPGPEFAGRPTPKFLVSGNGDGGLIDLVAAASANFDHDGMISDIIHQAGIERVFANLQDIDIEAREAANSGNDFDFLGAYDARVMPALLPLGLLERVKQRLRPGVQIVFQTRRPRVFTVESATLNRLAAYLVIRACEDDARAEFTHLHCPDLRSIPTPAVPPYDAPHWFECGSQTVGVDTAIIRHGPGRAAVRSPFTDILDGFDYAHKAWLLRHGDSARTPRLSSAAKIFFEDAARRHRVPMARWAEHIMIGQMPCRIAVQLRPGQVIWSGDALDGWLLKEVDRLVSDYIATGRDPGAVITLRAAPSVRARMALEWAEWRRQLSADHELLSRFLRLMICARDDDAVIDDARVLLGPRKLATIVRAVTVAVTVAAGWTAVAPSNTPPGNLAWIRSAGGPWTGHACGADLIDREPTALRAGRYIWRTNFVVLPMIDTPVNFALRSIAGLAKVESVQPSLRDVEDSPNIILTVDENFRAAVETGLEQLADYLARTEAAHFTRLRHAIEGAT